MYRVIVLYEKAPDPDAYEGHAEVCRRVPNATFRHGPVTGAPMGEAPYAYYAEFEWADEDSFERGLRSEEFAATGKDLRERGMDFPVAMFANVS